jgi:SAM-dependent methyltransferase
MKLRAWWKQFGLLCGQTPLHPQFLLNRQGRERKTRLQALLQGRILDLGSGDSSPLKNQRVSQYVRLDYPLTNAACQNPPDVLADAHSLPFPEGSFDGILLLEVLEHLRHPAQVVAEASRCLKGGGILAASTPFLYPLHDEPHDFCRLSKYGLEKLFPDSAWDRIGVDFLDHFPAFLALSLNLHFMHRLQNAAAKNQFWKFPFWLFLAGILVVPANTLALLSSGVSSPSRFPVNSFWILRKKQPPPFSRD